MEPIVSPWLVYLIMQLDALTGALVIIGGIASVSLVIGGIGFSMDDHRGGCIRIMKYSICVVITTLLLGVTIPSRDSAVAIIAAQHITKDNITASADVVRRVRDEVKGDIVEILRELTNEKETNNAEKSN